MNFNCLHRCFNWFTKCENFRTYLRDDLLTIPKIEHGQNFSTKVTMTDISRSCCLVFYSFLELNCFSLTNGKFTYIVQIKQTSMSHNSISKHSHDRYRCKLITNFKTLSSQRQYCIANTALNPLPHDFIRSKLKIEQTPTIIFNTDTRTSSREKKRKENTLAQFNFRDSVSLPVEKVSN